VAAAAGGPRPRGAALPAQRPRQPGQGPACERGAPARPAQRAAGAGACGVRRLEAAGVERRRGGTRHRHTPRPRMHMRCRTPQDPSGVRVRMRLQPLLQEAASSLLAPEQAGLRAISCPLGATGGVPLLPVSPGAFTRELVRLHTRARARLACVSHGACMRGVWMAHARLCGSSTGCKSPSPAASHHHDAQTRSQACSLWSTRCWCAGCTGRAPCAACWWRGRRACCGAASAAPTQRRCTAWPCAASSLLHARGRATGR
jgi:hypothetical protein